ncbi:MAG: pilus assembly protein [Methylocapsa sp.]|nr:pilus assembly protein [Methylocapsa sp.]
MGGFFQNETGIAAALFALAMPVVFGTIGLAVDVSNWYMHRRSMQNAADAAAIAAATATSNNAAEAQAVAAQLGYTNGSGNVKVTTTSPSPKPAGCPASQNCYNVTISDKASSFFAQAIGYNGAPTISASSVATSGPAYPYCILALNGQVSNDFTTNGAPKADLAGCNIMANSSATCHGHNLNANIGDAHGTNSGCGIIQHSNMPTVSDPYSGLASNIPTDSCGGIYYHEPTKKSGSPLPASNQLGNSNNTTTYTWSGNEIFCGDLQLMGNVEIDAPSNAVLVIENGTLDLNNNTLQTASGSGLTIVFTGSNGSSSQQYPTGGGTLDIAAPTSGTWSGMAIYQDPALLDTGGVLDFTYAGNSPTWNITGMVYFPNANVTFSGAVGKGTNGARCFGMVVSSLLINGTGSIFANDTQCSSAGLSLPKGGYRGQLVN